MPELKLRPTVRFTLRPAVRFTLRPAVRFTLRPDVLTMGIALGISLAALSAAAVVKAEQGPLDPALLLKPPADAWASYHGDYTGRHYSPLKQIDASNAKALSLAWFYRTTAATDNAVVGGPAPLAGATGFGGGAPAATTGPIIKAI